MWWWGGSEDDDLPRMRGRIFRVTSSVRGLLHADLDNLALLRWFVVAYILLFDYFECLERVLIHQWFQVRGFIYSASGLHPFYFIL